MSGWSDLRAKRTHLESMLARRAAWRKLLALLCRVADCGSRLRIELAHRPEERELTEVDVRGQLASFLPSDVDEPRSPYVAHALALFALTPGPRRLILRAGSCTDDAPGSLQPARRSARAPPGSAQALGSAPTSLERSESSSDVGLRHSAPGGPDGRSTRTAAASERRNTGCEDQQGPLDGHTECQEE